MSKSVDYSILDKHIEVLKQLAKVTNSGITVYDNLQQKHVFASYNFQNLFKYDMDRIEKENTDYFDLHIHPEDLVQLNRNGKATLDYFANKKEELINAKMINEYRILISETYTRVIEQYQVLEFTPDNEVWLSLSILDISPNQTELDKVQSKLMNCETGEIFYLYDLMDVPEGTELSSREKTILKLIRDGKLSKEISDELNISVHTVNTHRQRILRKMNSNNTLEAIKFASRYGLLN